MQVIYISTLIALALGVANARTCERPGSLLRRGTPRYAPDYGCCNSINISEKLDEGEEPFADQNIVGDYIVAGGDINYHNYYLSLDNEMAIWWMENFNGKGPMWVIGRPQNVGSTQNFAFGPGPKTALCMESTSSIEGETTWKGKDYEGQTSPLYLKMKCNA